MVDLCNTGHMNFRFDENGRQQFMNESDLLAIHVQQPLAARWFSLASHCLANGYKVDTYEPERFHAEKDEGADSSEQAFLATTEPDGCARWTWWWADDDDSDDAFMKEEGGRCDSPALVLVDWVRTAYP